MKNSTQMPTPSPKYSQDVEDYIIQCGFSLLPHSIMTDALVFIKGRMALILVDDSIEVKLAPINAVVNAAQIFFNWEVSTYYKGWDGKNMFQLMMLLDFMDVIKLKDVDRTVRTKITTQNLINSLSGINVNTTAVNQPA